jgi:beta-lactam-binding protein with PASTA domain
MSRPDAQGELEALGLLVNIVKVDTDDPKLVGIVLAQDPHGQTQVNQGTSITILVGREPKGNGDGGGKGNGGGGGGGGGGG